MGKASKWIRNFLMGKKEEKKNKKKDGPIDIIRGDSVVNTPNTILPNEKSRWSFGKSVASQSDFVFQSMKSFDSIINSKKLSKALVKYSENELHGQIEVTKAVNKTKHGLVEQRAATKIQAAFRSYLARRALYALRGLVKLQALVRGHLVRKQTTATLRCMHALLSIQVRARVQRIRLADESLSHSHNRSPRRDNVTLKEAYTVKEEKNMTEKRADFNKTTKSGDYPETKRIDIGLPRYSSRVQIPEQELHVQTPSSLSNLSNRYNTPTEKRTKQHLPAPFSIPLPDYYDDDQYACMPNYMINTESSKAKARSLSEPKQRPRKSGNKHKNRRTTSSGRLDFDVDELTQASSTNVRTNRVDDEHRLFAKIYRSTKEVHEESECDDMSMIADALNYRSMMAYEPPVDLYCTHNGQRAS